MVCSSRRGTRSTGLDWEKKPMTETLWFVEFFSWVGLSTVSALTVLLSNYFMILNTLVCYLFVFLFMRSLLHAKLICVHFTNTTLPQCGVSFFSESLAHCSLTSQSLLQAGCPRLAIQEEKLVGQVGPIPGPVRFGPVCYTSLLPTMVQPLSRLDKGSLRSPTRPLTPSHFRKIILRFFLGDMNISSI